MSYPKATGTPVLNFWLGNLICIERNISSMRSNSGAAPSNLLMVSIVEQLIKMMTRYGYRTTEALTWAQTQVVCLTEICPNHYAPPVRLAYLILIVGKMWARKSNSNTCLYEHEVVRKVCQLKLRFLNTFLRQG